MSDIDAAQALLAKAGIVLSDDPEVRDDQLANPDAYFNEVFEAADIGAEIVDGGVRVTLFIPLSAVNVNLTPDTDGG